MPSQPDLARPLEAAIAAARAADQLLRRALAEREPLQVALKGRHDFVTQVDRRSEALIAEMLRAACPEIGLLGEEGSGLDLEAPLIWAVDPLDGTSNFIHGYPAFAVSIGLLERCGASLSTDVDGFAEPVSDTSSDTVVATSSASLDTPSLRFSQVAGRRAVLGVVADVCQRRLYTGWRDGGAWRAELPADPGRPLGPPERLACGRAERLEEAFLATGFPIRRQDLARLYLNVFDALMPASAGLRRGGSAALDLAYTAAGVFDAFIELNLAPWDLAAGVCLVEEAGGAVAGLGGPALETGHVVAGQPSLVADVQTRLAGRL